MYTEEQIKKAFWSTFSGIGDVFFDYSEDRKDDDNMEAYWTEFLEHLKAQKQ